jgi:hypothetical protein
MEGNHRMKKIRMLYHTDDNIQISSLIEDFLKNLIDNGRVEIVYMVYVYDNDKEKQLYSMFFQFTYPKSTDSLRTTLKEVGLDGDKASFGKLVGLKENLFDSYIRYSLQQNVLPYVYYSDDLEKKYKDRISTI